jgi:ATPase subunit of ABC transporter with duplicated ATPase domains
MKQVLTLSRARKSYDSKVVLDEVTLAFLPGAKIGVVGPNGMGKSTLLRMMAGLEQPSNGEVRLMPGYTVGILAREPALDEDKTVLGNVEAGVAETKDAYPYQGNYSTYLETKAARMKVEGQRDARLRRRLEQELEWVRSSPRARQAKSRARLGRYEQMAAEAASRQRLDFEQIQIPPGPRLGTLVVEADDLAKEFGDRLLIGGLSFSLPPTLKQGGNLLLLDEPANDRDTQTLASLEEALLDFPGCAVITSHDRWFLDRVATHILAWEGEADWFWFEGNFEAYEQNKTDRLGAEAARPHRVTYRKLTR